MHPSESGHSQGFRLRGLAFPLRGHGAHGVSAGLAGLDCNNSFFRQHESPCQWTPRSKNLSRSWAAAARDPLSPMLFVLVMEELNALVASANW